MKIRNDWRSRRWGVVFWSDQTDAMLIGETWHPHRNELAKYRTREDWQEIPARALLFKTRAQCRAWCRSQMATWKEGDRIVRKWRVKPVRVIETVGIAKK